MATIIGYVKSAIGVFYAKDPQGHSRELHIGDPIY